MTTSITRDSLVNLASRVAAVLLVLGITLHTARLGAAQQGAFALFMAVEAVLLACMSGFGVSIARRISHHGETPAGLVGATVLACLAIGLSTSALLAEFAPVFLGGDIALALVALAPVLFLAPNLSGIWLGQARMGALARITLGTPALCLGGILLCELAGRASGLATVVWAWVAARWFVGLAALFASHRSGLVSRPDGAALAREFRWVAVVGLTNLVGLMNYKVDLFLVEGYLGIHSTGVYSIAVMAAESLWLVSSSLTSAVYARIGTPDPAAAARLTVRSAHVSALVLGCLSLPLWVAAAVAVPWLLGASYRPAIAALAMLLPGVVLFGAGSVLSAWFTNHAGRPRVPAMLALLSLCINIVVSIVAIPRWGMLGAALATSLSYTAAIAAGLFLFARASATPLRSLLWPDWPWLLSELRRLKPTLAKA